MLKKSLLGLFAFSLLALTLLAQHADGQAIKKKKPTEPDPEPPVEIKDDPKADLVHRIVWALDLAEQGRKEKSPATLISAAVALRRIPPLEEMKDRPETNNDADQKVPGEAPVKTKTLRDQSEELLTEAKILAAQLKADGKFTSEQLAAVATLAQSVLDEPLTRGALGGPKIFQNPLLPRYSDRWDVRFVNGFPAVIVITGAGNSMLTADLYQGTRRISTFSGTVIRFAWPVIARGVTSNYHVRIRNTGAQATVYRMFTN